MDGWINNDRAEFLESGWMDDDPKAMCRRSSSKIQWFDGPMVHPGQMENSRRPLCPPHRPVHPTDSPIFPVRGGPRQPPWRLLPAIATASRARRFSRNGQDPSDTGPGDTEPSPLGNCELASRALAIGRIPRIGHGRRRQRSRDDERLTKSLSE
jgi:hypothetical protein